MPVSVPPDVPPAGGGGGWRGSPDGSGAFDGSGVPGAGCPGGPAVPSGCLPDDLLDGSEWRQGIWLTARVELPLDVLAGLAGAPDENGAGAGFGQDGVLERQPPGAALAAFLPDPAADPAVGGSGAVAGAVAPGAAGSGELGGLGGLGDEELTGVIRGFRRLASWAAAGELAAVAELCARRDGGPAARNVEELAGGAVAEVAAALRLTSASADLLVERAEMLRQLPGTAAALACGLIDVPRALVIVAGLADLAGRDLELARGVESRVLEKAPGQTTGQLRAALNRALLAADPRAAERRREAEEQRARVEQGPEPGGVTAVLAGRYLPVAATAAAWQRITAIARALKKAGAEGSLDQIRARVYLALLLGQQPAPSPAEDPSHVNQPRAGGPGPAGGSRTGDPGQAGDPSTAGGSGTGGRDQGGGSGAGSSGRSAGSTGGASGNGRPGDGGAGNGGAGGPAEPPGASGETGTGLSGAVNLTLPLATLTGAADAPGELGGFGPITGHAAREIARSALGQPALRWCVTVTGPDGAPAGHGCATRARPLPAGDPGTPGTDGWTFTVTVTALARGHCAHERESSGYQPSPSLRHLIEIRSQRCGFPGCRRPAERCDKDHTIPYDQGGRTCECNLAPLCRYHHRVKQLQGWRLEQPEPGILVWVTPSGWKHIVTPDAHPI
jgi:Domain of unknown function (DUF222)/HNH endonuclease